ncbi:family 78 glycoside hydrolase catalytic domain [Clostridium grantii]|uniref:alpha-L-rhamnosidase n=1 Tax=Clostridium grantii DSM 8605 TaxID=1121316 RepID=A0A1M5XRT0_9CLOT|nr:family 78 glycoside hydrolase catalytic domain [Clostridium grantii]SHI02490.1 Alpha-L-rhamnosidase N-terminal domain-containing protein [Clostridium grantii DSM 8605]
MIQWQAKWIIDPEFLGLKTIDIFHKEKDKREYGVHREDFKNRHMLIRKKFSIDEIKEKAYINITADDYYKLYINGHFVGQGPAPSYYFEYNYNHYDINQYLNDGDNIIAVHVYYQGLVNRVWNSGDYRQGMIAEVFVDKKLVLTTDNTWKYHISESYQSGGITGYDTQFLENIDSRLWDEDWMTLDYNDVHWKQVCEHEKDDHKLFLQKSSNLSVYSMDAETIEKIKENHYLIDFGQEITGQFQMIAQGKTGQIIEIRCGEELEELDSHRVRYNMRCNCFYQEFWTLSGRKEQLNFYDYKGFRYVEVIASEDVVMDKEFKAIVRHYPFDNDSFRFKSSNDRVDRVLDICKNGVKYGSQEVYVDCPTREKGQYLGDFTVTGHSHIYLTGETLLYKKALKDFALSTFICPGIMAVAPGALMQEIADFSMQWPMQLFQYYLQSGDRDFLEEMYPVMVNLEKYFEAYKREDGLLHKIDEKWNLVDWPENLRDGYDCELTKPIGDECHNVINAFYYGMISYIEKIREILNITNVNNLVAFKESFVNAFYNKETKLFIDKENSEHSAIHSNALPLLFDLFPSSDVEKAVNLIKNRAHKCGVQMSYFVLKALAKAEAYDEIFKLIENLWGTMIEEGATTCFEVWGKNQKWNTSLCHPWASAPIPIIVEDIIGIKPASPGWEKIRFVPHIPDTLDYFSFNIKVKTGLIHIEKNNGVIEFKGPTGIEVVN